jgi:hypothetical protein
MRNSGSERHFRLASESNKAYLALIDTLILIYFMRFSIMTVILLGQEFAHQEYIKEYLKRSYSPRKNCFAQPYHAW